MKKCYRDIFLVFLYVTPIFSNMFLAKFRIQTFEISSGTIISTARIEICIKEAIVSSVGIFFLEFHSTPAQNMVYVSISSLQKRLILDERNARARRGEIHNLGALAQWAFQSLNLPKAPINATISRILRHLDILPAEISRSLKQISPQAWREQWYRASAICTDFGLIQSSGI